MAKFDWSKLVCPNAAQAKMYVNDSHCVVENGILYVNENNRACNYRWCIG